MQTDRNLSAIHSELRPLFPKLTVVQLARLINSFFNDSDLVVNTDYIKDYDVVDGTKFYAIPTDKNIISIRSVHYLASDGKYKPLPEYVGTTLMGDT